MEDKKDITVICCKNNERKYQMFIDSLNKQTVSFELFCIDNKNNKYKSIASAYNSVLRKIETKFVIFSHQDIILQNETLLERFVSFLTQISNQDILGVAGVKSDPIGLYTNILHGSDQKYAGNYRVHGLLECETVDECFFGGYTELFVNNPFDEKLCNSWHLYAVEKCLNVRLNGGKVFVCDMPLLHTSAGRADKKYVLGFYKILKHYKNDYPLIVTTVHSSRTNSFEANKYLIVKYFLLTYADVYSFYRKNFRHLFHRKK